MSTLVENVAKVKSAHDALSAAIEAKGVVVPAGTKLTGMPALVDQIQTGGGGGSEPTNDRVVFANDSSTSLTVPSTVVVNMGEATDLQNCFYKCTNLTSLILQAGFGQNATNLARCFSDCGNLTSLELPTGFGQNATNLARCFGGCSNLTSLALPTGFGRNATDLYYCFVICYELTEITGNPNFKTSVGFSDSIKLTHDSLMVIINGLQTVTETQTLTLGTENLAKLSDAEKQIATNKGWTLA